jgi:xanthine/CO dehydrogenase XdhC/CoxF family maturation factor
MQASEMRVRNNLDDVLTEAAAWHKESRQVAIATVVGTWGSSPRPVGSQMAIDATGRFTGSVSGGCLEAAVVEEALQVIATKKPKLLEFNVADETAWSVGLACGGRLMLTEYRWHWLLISKPATNAW